MTTSVRKDWDTYFMDIAYMVSTRSRCPRRHVGAVLVQGKKLLGTAYNGAPMGVPDCSEAGCMIVEQYEKIAVDGEEQMVKKERCIRTIHAEQNLLLFTDRIDREGSTVYVTDEPCWTCANMLANSGVTEIVYHRPYPKDSEKVAAMMKQKGITFRTLASYQPPQETIMDTTD
ncbi:dCMP deaminase family protein [Paenibacillus melissococcoides]|uniref:dCMP deaminase family protein n=1 Tax=Paenibacillus melissococcoides TaxID=2912268 RepID=A0ABN8U8P6_9BACL|nr:MULTISPECIES: dCMP deaminase family protein [Paenibacillus]MEB9897546.1 dCMP deaminase family protein [Bacillus cereus]CAH8247415.1 dCMP deaminase family protein [Paenibacillus melissococcoides]CAH8705213.1 dCMP deaminase family protein [Paenibacillus melissococcoides]CAH8708435.1 dCMP deaminase family protein [Paenibacillus melissococcoides]GIO79402.1 deaminase [Paenibacillus dendritiformis]